jgi:hypothetical protein
MPIWLFFAAFVLTYLFFAIAESIFARAEPGNDKSEKTSSRSKSAYSSLLSAIPKVSVAAIAALALVGGVYFQRLYDYNDQRAQAQEKALLENIARISSLLALISNQDPFKRNFDMTKIAEEYDKFIVAYRGEGLYHLDKEARHCFESIRHQIDVRLHQIHDAQQKNKTQPRKFESEKLIGILERTIESARRSNDALSSAFLGSVIRIFRKPVGTCDG